MAEYAIVNNTITMSLDYLENLIKNAIEDSARVSVDRGVEAFRIEQMKANNMTPKEAKAYLGVSYLTLNKYTENGHKKAGKLPYESKGEQKQYNEYDLHVFKQKMKA